MTGPNYDPLYRLAPERSRQSPPVGFEDFWRAYPKKIARADAMRAFAMVVQQATPSEIIRGAIRYAAERKGEDPRYTKNPATWLNKGCWKDPSPPFHALPRAGPWQSNSFDRSIVAQLHDDGDFDEVVARIRQQRNKKG